jgi:hypothetical protein
MASFDGIVLRNTNPFDPINVFNEKEPIVDYIYQEAFIKIERKFNEVVQNNYTRTVLINGDNGSNNEYLLSRLYQQFSHKALFVYIPPFPQREVIWRHILRYTVDSLITTSDINKKSELLPWVSKFKQDIKSDDIFNFLKSKPKQQQQRQEHQLRPSGFELPVIVGLSASLYKSSGQLSTDLLIQ